VRDWTWSTDYTNQNFGVNGVGVALSFELPIHDRNQGEIARTEAAAKQAVETESSAQVGVLTDVVNAYYALRTGEEVVALFEGGYLDQATQSRDITSYAYQRGSASILDLLDAERSYRAVQLAYRQAEAAHMIAAEQVNQAVGTQVIQ
jgi:outer membrane protein, heavy metal efflux system